MSSLRRCRQAALALVLLGWASSGCQSTSNHQNPHPTYGVEAEIDPRTNGRWMVYAVGEDTSDPNQTRYSVTCWHDSDPATFRAVEITEQIYREYLRNPDTGSIACPTPLPALPR